MGFAPVRPHLPKLEQKLSEGLILSNAELKTLRKAAPLAAVRKLAVAMHFEAYNKLGMSYKVKHNFYGRAVVQAWTHMPAKVKYPIAAALVGAFGFTVKMLQSLRN